MKIQFAMVAAVALLGLSACSSSPQSRIESDPRSYATASKDVQAKIRAGQIDVGFTREQVRLALGDPTGVSTRTTGSGASEVWSYHDKGPRFGFGVGVGGGGGGVGVGVGTGERSDEPRLRVVFENDRVASIEQKAEGKK